MFDANQRIELNLHVKIISQEKNGHQIQYGEFSSTGFAIIIIKKNAFGLFLT